MEFLDTIRRPDDLWVLRRQAMALIELSRRDVGLLVALLAAITPEDLHEALQELGWYGEVEQREQQRQAEEARLRLRIETALQQGAVKALEARLRADPDLADAVLHTAASDEGRALLAQEFELTRHSFASVLRRLRKNPAGVGR